MSEFVSTTVRRGMTRLYAVVAIPWVLALGYVAFDAHRGAEEARAEAPSWARLTEEAEGKARERRLLADQLGATGEDRKELIRDTEIESAVARGYYRALVNKRDNGASRRNLALYALPTVPVGAPILWFIYLWVAAGFRKVAD